MWSRAEVLYPSRERILARTARGLPPVLEYPTGQREYTWMPLSSPYTMNILLKKSLSRLNPPYNVPSVSMRMTFCVSLNRVSFLSLRMAMRSYTRYRAAYRLVPVLFPWPVGDR